MTEYLDSANFPTVSADEKLTLARELEALIESDLKKGVLPMLGEFRCILADNERRNEWDGIFSKLMTLFKCGKNETLNGPMIGVTLVIRDPDYFKETVSLLGEDRSNIADIEWMATSWNAAFANSGIWMGKTFEPVSRKIFSDVCGGEPNMLKQYDPGVSRIGRNFFREPVRPTIIQELGLPVLTKLWHLRNRPFDSKTDGFKGDLLMENLNKEITIPYSMTGGYFLANPGVSVVTEMNARKVYQLNYRWTGLDPVYPMTRLIDELVQIADGLYLGQLVMATRHYSLGTLGMSLSGKQKRDMELGEDYCPGHPCGMAQMASLFSRATETHIDYGYQNNGFFLMIDPVNAKEAYADNAFSFLRPHPGESGYKELGYDQNSCNDVG